MRIQDLAEASNLAAEKERLEAMREKVQNIVTIGEVVGYDREDASLSFGDRQEFDLREICNPSDRQTALDAGKLIRGVLLEAIDARHSAVKQRLVDLGVKDVRSL